MLLTTAGDSNSLPGFQLSEGSKEVPVVHSEGFSQEAAVSHGRARSIMALNRGENKSGREVFQ